MSNKWQKRTPQNGKSKLPKNVLSKQAIMALTASSVTFGNFAPMNAVVSEAGGVTLYNFDQDTSIPFDHNKLGGSSQAWQISSKAIESSDKFISAYIGSGESTGLSFEVDSNGGEMTFDYELNSSQGFDYVSIDGSGYYIGDFNSFDSGDGSDGWAVFSTYLDPGTHTIEFYFTIDQFDAGGFVDFKMDNLSLPVDPPNMAPVLEVVSPANSSKDNGTVYTTGYITNESGQTVDLWYEVLDVNGVVKKTATKAKTITTTGVRQNFGFDADLSSLPEAGTNGYNIRYWAVDNMGESTSKIQRKIILDKTPATLSVTSSNTAPTTQPVTLTFTPNSSDITEVYVYSDSGDVDYYEDKSGDPQPFTITVNHNDTLYMETYDDAGNYNYQEYSVTNFKPSTPTYTVLSSDASTGTQVIRVNFPTGTKSYNISEESYRGSGGNIVPLNAGQTYEDFTLEDGTTLWINAIDGNNYSSEVLTLANVDTLANPTPTFSPSIASTTNQDVNVTINYPSNHPSNDVSVKQYSLNGGSTWATYTGPVKMTANGTIKARSIDSAGNVSSIGTYNVTNIDKTPPITPSISADVTTATNGNVVLTVSYPADASVKEYSVNGGSTWTAYTGAITMTANGNLQARAKDSAGNLSTVTSYSVTNIDKTPPSNATLTPSTTAMTNQDVSVTISYPADASVKQYKVGLTGTWTSYSTPVILSSNDTVYARSFDAVGNVSSETSLTVSNIDKVAPTTPTISADKTTATNGNVVLTATFPADAFVKEYSTNGGSTWTAYTAPVTMTANGTLQVRAKDSANNVSAVASYTVSNIDKTPPANATLSASTTSPTNQNVSVTISYPSDASVKQYKIGSGGIWTTYTAPVVVSANDTVYARSFDAVGNVSSETSLVVSNIDKIAPTTPSISADVTTATNGNVVLTATFPSDASVKEYSTNGGSTWTAYTSPITMTANGTLQARAKDDAGNYSTVASYTVSNIDKTAPVNATLTASTTSPTNQDVSVTISYPSDASVKEFKIGSTGTWTAYTSPVVLSANNTIYARSKDAVGNLSNESSLVVSNIDKVAPTTPTISADVTANTNGNVVLTATFPADATVKEYSTNGGSTWTTYTGSVTMTANGTFQARAKDDAGNYSAVASYSVTNIDKTPPANATLSASTTASTNQDVSVTITYPSDASVKQYKIGSGGTWTSYTAPVVLSANDTVYARSIDAVGNVSSETSLVVSNIDKVAPTQPTISADVATATNGNVVLTVSYPADASVKEYSVNGGTTWTAYSGAVTMTANGTLQARAKDSAGNYSTVASYTVSNIDKTPPANATLSANTTAPTNQNVSVTINYPADASVKQYKIGSGGTWTTYTSPVVLSANDTVYARSIDAVGNVSAETNLVVSNIDKVAPTTPSISADKTTPTNGNVVLTVSYPADASVKEFSLNGGSTWTAYSGAVTMTDNGTLQARAKDSAGNYSTVASYTVSNIDKTAPVNATLTASTTSPTNQDVNVTISYPSDANVKEYKIGSTGTWTVYTTPVVLSANNTVYARSTDAVGNMSLESSLVVGNIDKTAPTVPTLVADKTTDTNTDVIVTVTYPADATVKEYSTNGGSTWTAYTTPIVMKNNGTVQARAKDDAGNYSTIGTYVVSNIDKTAPLNPSFVASITAPTNQNVSVTINYPADASVKQYKIGSGGTWTTYTTPVVLSSNDTVYARGYDAVGNVSSEVTFDVTNIDKVAPTQPTISADKTTATNGNVILTATFPSDASVKEYRVNNGSWTAYTAPVTMTANGKLEVRAKDDAGNYSSVASYDVSNIDKTAPANATLSASTSSPTNQNVTVTINYPSDASVKQYKIGLGGTWTSYTAPVVLSANDTVYARSIDAVGNVSAETNLSVNNIDKVAPTTPTISADVTADTNGNVILTATFPADASVKEYSVNGGTTWTAYTNPVTMTANGTFQARAKDSAGNYSTVASYTVDNIDKTAPLNATLSASTTAPTNGNVSVTITYPSDASVKQYKVGSTGTWTSYTAPVLLSANDTVYARSYDAVGNVSAETSLDVTNIDKVAPITPTISADVTADTNGNVVLTATFPVDASVKEYSVNGGTTWVSYVNPVSMTTNGTFQARAKDSAGNVSAVASYTVSNIDKTPPANATFVADKTTDTNTDVKVTINYPSDASVKQYKIGSTGTWTTYSTPVVVSSNDTVYARSYDTVGNVSAETNYVVNNIDKVAPTTPTIQTDITADTNGNVVLTATFPSDATVKEYSLNGGTTWVAYTSPVTFTANGTFQARAKDSAGNVSAVASYSVDNIDKTAPMNATLSASTTAPTNGNVSVTINYPSDASVKQYKIGSTGTWTAYTSPVVLTSNNTVYARSMDAVGNVSNETSLDVTNIDKTAPNAPTVSADVTTATNGNVVVTASFPADAVVKEYSTNGGSTWTAYTSGVTFTSNGTFQARAKDSAGNYSTVTSYTVSNIDKTAPANATFSADKTSATNSDVTVTISYPSDASVKQYKVGSTGTWTNYTTPVVVSANNTVYARSYDAVGNISAESSYVVSNIDKVAPTTPTISADVTEDTNGNVILTASFPADAVVKEYSLNGGTTWVAYTSPVTFSSNGTFQVRAKDSANNVSAVANYSVDNIDKTAPLNATLSASTTAPTNGNVSVTITYPSDAVTKQYKIGSGGTWTSYTAPVVVSSNDTVYARSYDAVGNVSGETSLTVTNIDKIAPNAPTVSADVTEATNGNVVVTATFPVDATVKEYSTNGGSTWTAYASGVTFTSNGTFQARAKDSAGNVSAVTTYTVSNIDKTAPANATFVADKTTATNTDVKVTVNYPSDASVKQYKVGSTGTWTNYTTPVVVSSNNTVYARSYDAVGNVSVETNYVVSNIDKVSPTTPTISADVTSATNGNVILTATFPSDAEVKEYSTNGGSTWTAYTSPITMTANGTLQVRAKDDADNYSAIGSYTVSNIDKTAPVNATLSASTTSPTNQNVSVTISYPSDASVKEYKIGSGGTWTAYTTPVVLTSNNTVFARSKDAVGNVSSESSLSVTNIDKTAPTTPVISADVTTDTNGDVALTVSYPADASVKEYSLNDGQTWLAYSNPVKMTANGTLQARAKDSAGNYSAIGSYTVDNIDKTAPVNATFSADKTTDTNTDVTVTISYPSDASIKQYKVGSTGTWTNYTTPVVVSANNTVYARSYDAVGNISAESSYVVSNIDKVAPTTPTISADVTADTNGDVTLTATFPSDATVKEYSLNGGSTWTAYTTPVKFTANGTFQVRAKDKAGNVSTIAGYTVDNIDKTAPVNATFSADKTSATNTDVKVTINFPADASVKQYKIGSTGTWTSYTTPVVVTANNTVYARSYDAVGNVSAETSYVVSNIDKVAPNAPTVTADVTEDTNGDVFVTVSYPSDANVKEYSVNGGTTWVAYTSPLKFTANGTLQARAKDDAGNYSTVTSYTVSNIDKTAPVSATFSADKTNATNTDVKVTINFPADASVKQYKVGSTGTWTTYSTPVVVTANNTVYARSYDTVGNVSAESNYAVTNIDKTAPNAPTLVADKTAPTNGNVVVTATFPSDAVVKEYRQNNGSWMVYTSSITFTANGTMEVRAKDEAGNYSTVTSYEVDNIDKIAPDVATLAPNTTAPTNQNVSVTISYPSDANVKEYKIGSTGTWTAYTTPVVLSANNTVYARSYDAVGNISAESSLVVSNIDKVAPTTPTFVADKTADTNTDVVVTVTYPSDASVKEYSLNGGSTWVAYTSPIVMTANGTVKARAKDVAGNYSTIGSYDVTNIDKTAPVNATLTASTTSPTNQNVSVTITYPSDASVKQYKIGSAGTWTAYTTPVVLSANNTVYARSIDAVGNVSQETTLDVTNIDKVAPTTPTVSPDVTANTNGNVVLTATFPVDAVVKEYRVDNGSWTAYVNPVTMTKNGMFEVRAKDNAGNYSAIGSYEVDNIDKTAPANATLSADKTTATNTDVKVTISYPSDAIVKQYKVGATGTWINYTTPVTVSSNNTVYARSYDAVGNVSAETSYSVTNIDKTAPLQPTISADKTTPTNGDVALTVTFPADAIVKEYSVNGGSTWTAYTSPVTMTANGTLTARAKDDAGNYSTVASYTVDNIDKTAPENATLSASTTASTNQNVTVTIAYPSDASVKEYKVGNGLWTAYTTPVVVTDNTTVYARSKDAVGNVSSETSLVVGNIDKVAPTTPTFVADKTNATNTDVKITVNFPADASVKEVKINGGNWTTYTTPIVMSVNGTIEARAKDDAGNYSTVGSYQVTNIDKTAPVNPSFVASTTAPTNQDVAVTINFPGDATVKQYKVGENGTWTSYTTPVVVSANNTIYARGYDAVGNASQEVTFDVKNIDKVAPNVPTLSADKTNPTNTNVVVTATFPADASVKEVSVNGGSWNPYTAPIMMTANGTVQVRAKDNAGNYSAVGTYQVTNIDKTKPIVATFQADKTAPTNKDVTVTVTFPSDTVKQEVSVNGGAWVNYDSPLVFNTNGTVQARGWDNAGNVSDVSSYEVSNIDLSVPTLPTYAVEESKNTITLSQDGNDKIFYRLNDGQWIEYKAPVVTNDGAYKVDAKIVDEAGNESELVTSNANMYRDALKEAQDAIQLAESNPTQENVDSAKEKLDTLPEDAPELQPLTDRAEDVQDVVDVIKAIEQATESNNPDDVKHAQDLIDLLDKTNPVIIDILDDIQADFEVADMLSLVSKERYDVLSSKYGMSKVAYDALVNIYYAMKYSGDYMYKYAGDKVALVPTNDKHYSFVQEQYTELQKIYDDYVNERVQTDAEIKAESSVKTMESNYDPVYAVNTTQKLIDAVEDATVRASLQQRLDNAKAKYEASLLVKADQEAIASVEKAESTKNSYYISEAYKKVNALTNETLKAQLTTRLQTLEAQIALDRKIADATRTVELAEQYKQQSYIDSAQTKINALPSGEAKTSLQQRLDVVKASMPTEDQATIISKARNAVSLAQSLKTQYYVDKAQVLINQIIDVETKAELQGKLNAIVVK